MIAQSNRVAPTHSFVRMEEEWPVGGADVTYKNVAENVRPLGLVRKEKEEKSREREELVQTRSETENAIACLHEESTEMLTNSKKAREEARVHRKHLKCYEEALKMVGNRGRAVENEFFMLEREETRITSPKTLNEMALLERFSNERTDKLKEMLSDAKSDKRRGDLLEKLVGEAALREGFRDSLERERERAREIIRRVRAERDVMAEDMATLVAVERGSQDQDKIIDLDKLMQSHDASEAAQHTRLLSLMPRKDCREEAALFDGRFKEVMMRFAAAKAAIVGITSADSESFPLLREYNVARDKGRRMEAEAERIGLVCNKQNEPGAIDEDGHLKNRPRKRNANKKGEVDEEEERRRKTRNKDYPRRRRPSTPKEAEELRERQANKNPDGTTPRKGTKIKTDEEKEVQRWRDENRNENGRMPRKSRAKPKQDQV